jgi:hypothetical protein
MMFWYFLCSFDRFEVGRKIPLRCSAVRGGAGWLGSLEIW